MINKVDLTRPKLKIHDWTEIGNIRKQHKASFETSKRENTENYY
jgi:hypothetical protein